MNDPCKHEGERVLLVEGKNDCHVILAICAHYQVPETFGIYRCDNDENVLKRLNALIIKPDPPETIGIVLDADQRGVMNRWQQFRKKIHGHGYSFPGQPDPGGTILKGMERKSGIGIWLMPNNKETGMLEDFLIPMVAGEAVKAAENCVDKARAKGVATYKKNHRSKAVIHTYLAWQDEPGRPLGQAVTANVLQPETELAKKFVNWLQKLFKV
jgi:hypothetical protein